MPVDPLESSIAEAMTHVEQWKDGLTTDVQARLFTKDAGGHEFVNAATLLIMADYAYRCALDAHAKQDASMLHAYLHMEIMARAMFNVLTARDVHGRDIPADISSLTS
jgi:hypothetical protein